MRGAGMRSHHFHHSDIHSWIHFTVHPLRDSYIAQEIRHILHC